MTRLRFVLVLVVAVALDFAPPLPSEAAEALEEFGHSARRSQQRQRLARDVAPPRETAAVTSAVQRRPLTIAPHRRPVTVAFVPKLPAALAESAPAPEGH